MEDRQIQSEPYRYGYQGQFSELDSLTKLNHFELRNYDARFGRWLSPDPYGVGDSPYIGMGNNPVTLADPDGGCPWCVWSEEIGDWVLPEVTVTASRGAASLTSLLVPASSALIRLEQGGSSTFMNQSNQWVNSNPNTGDVYMHNGQNWTYQGNTYQTQNAEARGMQDFSTRASQFVGEDVPATLMLAEGVLAFGTRLTLNLATKGGVQFTKSSLSLGRQVHAGYKAGLADGVNTFKEFTGIKGIRPDFVDFSTKTIYELKPFNPKSIQLGTKQLSNYKALFQQKYGGLWNTVLDTY